MNSENRGLHLAQIRQEYAQQELTEEHANPNALEQFQTWMSQAIAADVLEPTAMVLATAAANGQPSARVVLLKELDSGFVFFTNYNSRKGAELSQNQKAAITFFWPQLERQVRIEGTVVKINPEESDTYFTSRPKGSQIGALASPQSQAISSREILENKVKELEEQYKEQPAIARPAHWGGYRLQPAQVEFWQGRPSRLHDRLRYTKTQTGWQIERLAP